MLYYLSRPKVRQGMILQGCETGIFKFSIRVTRPGATGIVDVLSHPFDSGQIGFGTSILSVWRIIAKCNAGQEINVIQLLSAAV